MTPPQPEPARGAELLDLVGAWIAHVDEINVLRRAKGLPDAVLDQSSDFLDWVAETRARPPLDSTGEGYVSSNS